MESSDEKKSSKTISIVIAVVAVIIILIVVGLVLWLIFSEVSSGRSCSGDVQCAGYRCVSGTCETQCAYDANCALGYRCNASGQCVRQVVPRSVTPTTNDCGNYKPNSDGSCPNSCSLNSQCTSGNVCVNGACVSSTSVVTPPVALAINEQEFIAETPSIAQQDLISLQPEETQSVANVFGDDFYTSFMSQPPMYAGQNNIQQPPMYAGQNNIQQPPMYVPQVTTEANWSKTRGANTLSAEAQQNILDLFRS